MVECVGGGGILMVVGLWVGVEEEVVVVVVVVVEVEPLVECCC